MVFVDCTICRHSEEYNDWDQGNEIACSRCFTMINTDTAETREPTKKELISTAKMFDNDYAEFVLNKYYNKRGLNVTEM